MTQNATIYQELSGVCPESCPSASTKLNISFQGFARAWMLGVAEHKSKGDNSWSSIGLGLLCKFYHALADPIGYSQQ